MREAARTMGRKGGVLGSVARLAKQPLYANAGYLLGANVVNALAGFAFWGIAARLYNPQQVGVASAVLSAVALVAGIAILGLGNGLVRFLPQAPAPARLLGTVLTFVAAMGLLVGGVYLAGLDLWSPSLITLRRSAPYAIGFLAYAAAMTLAAVLRMAFLARRRAGYAFIQACVISGGRLLLAGLLAGLGTAGLVGSVAVAVVLAVALSLLVFLPRVEPGYRPGPRLHWPDLAGVLPYSAGNYLATLSARTPQIVLPLLVLETLGAVPSGHTYIAWMLGSLLTSPGMALASSAFAEGSNDPQQLSAILVRSAALGLLVTVPAALVLGAISPWFLLLFGPGYAQEAAGLLRWLAGAAPLVVLCRLYYTHLRVRKRVGLLIAMSGLVAAITLGAAALGMPRHGIAASGVGWLVGNGLVALLAAGTIWHRARGDRDMTETELVEKLADLGERKPLVVAAIPCYNEERFIGDVVHKTKRHADVVVVVDDGSSDDTVIRAQEAGAQTVVHPTNLGPGAAARSCLQAGRDLGADVLVTLDGDGQHDADEIPDVIAPVLSGEADVVIGSRFLGAYNNVAAYRRFGIGVITTLYNLGARGQITDGQSCFRAHNRRTLETLRITDLGFGFSVQTLVQARSAGLRIGEASISCVYHEESHSMNPVKHGVGVALMVVKHRALDAWHKVMGNGHATSHHGDTVGTEHGHE